MPPSKIISMASSQPRYGGIQSTTSKPADFKLNAEFLSYLARGTEAGWLQRFDNAARKLPVFLELGLTQQHAIAYVAHEYVGDQTFFW